MKTKRANLQQKNVVSFLYVAFSSSEYDLPPALLCLFGVAFYLLLGTDKVHFPKRQILDPSKQKEIADDNFKCEENGGKLSIQVENTVEKGEIVRNEFFPQYF